MAESSNKASAKAVKRTELKYWAARLQVAKTRADQRRDLAMARLEQARAAVQAIGGTLPDDEAQAFADLVEYDRSKRWLVLGGATKLVDVEPDDDEPALEVGKLLVGFSAKAARDQRRAWFPNPEDAPAVMADPRYWQARSAGWELHRERELSGAPKADSFDQAAWAWWTSFSPKLRAAMVIEHQDAEGKPVASAVGIRRSSPPARIFRLKKIVEKKPRQRGVFGATQAGLNIPDASKSAITAASK